VVGKGSGDLCLEFWYSYAMTTAAVLIADYKSLRKLVVSKPFQGRMISVQRVAHTSCVIVDGVSHLSEDMITLHFENSRRSGGGEVKAVTKHNDFAIVEFKDRNGRLQYIQHNCLVPVRS